MSFISVGGCQFFWASGKRDVLILFGCSITFEGSSYPVHFFLDDGPVVGVGVGCWKLQGQTIQLEWA